MSQARVLIGCAIFAGIALAKHAYKKLSEKELTDAKQIAEQLRTFDGRTNNLRQLTKEDQPWATQIDMTDMRFDGIGNLFIVEIIDGTPFFPWLIQKVAGKTDPNKPNPNVKPHPPKHCTAFKIGADLLATAGHCLRDAGVTESSPHALIFRRHYDATKKFTADLAKTHENVIQEWIYPEEYVNKAPSVWAMQSGYDYAFLRTETPIGGGDPYILVRPDEYIAATTNVKLLAVGYPSEYAARFQMVSVACKLAVANDPLVKDDKGLLAIMDENKSLQIETISGNQIFCAGELGNMQEGGSGGPWLLDVAADDPERAEKLRKVVGIQSWTWGRDIPAELWDFESSSHAQWLAKVKEQQEFAKLSVSAWFKNKAIKIYDAIIKSHASESMLTTAEDAELPVVPMCS